MKYTVRNSSGDIGAHLVAFKFLKLLNWPCRLADIDIGIDAEVEMISEDDESQGDIMKVQIKHSAQFPDHETFSVSTYERHIEYWSRFCVPLIFCAAESNSMKVYWRQITDLDCYDTEGASKKVTFNRSEHELTETCKDRFLELVIPNESRNLGERIGEIKQLLDGLDGEPLGQELVNHYYEQLKLISVKIDKVKEIVVHFPWRLPGTHKHHLEQIEQHYRSLRQKTDMASNDLHN